METTAAAPPIVLVLDEGLIVKDLFIAAGGEAMRAGISRHLAEIDLPQSATLAEQASLVSQDHRARDIALTDDGLRARIMPRNHGAGLAIVIDDVLATPSPQPDDSTEAALAAARHRFVNSLQLVRSVVRRSAEIADDPQTCSFQLEGRLDALNRVVSALIRDPHARFPLSTLIFDALEEQGLSQWTGCADIDGPDIRFSGETAQSLALLFHELAANGVLHGNLGPGNGSSLTIGWQVLQEDLRIDWVERGHHFHPGRPGFGMWVMDEMVPYELDGKVTREAVGDTFRIRITLPITRL